jgi:uncharacterized peroxidase-related enzyme
MARIAPLTIDETAELKDFFTVWQQRMGYVPNTLLTLARKPKVVRALAALSEAVHDPDNSIAPELRTLVGVIASHAHGCQYCLAHTAANAGRVGVDPQKIDLVWEYAHNPLFSEAERAALDLALCAAQVPNAVTDAHFERARAHFSDTELVEILAVVAYYGWFNRLNASLGTTLEDLPKGFAEANLRTLGWTLGHHG